MSFCGYGWYGNGEDGAKGYDGQRRVVDNVVDAFGGEAVSLTLRNGLYIDVGQFSSNLFCGF